MREIKFRAWDNQDKKMMSYFWVNAEGGGVWEQDGMDKMITCPKDRFFLMQYTGRKDKNGTDIIEGDNVKVTDEHGNIDRGPVWYVPERMAYCIVWHEGEANFSLANVKDSIEVIGNVYEK